MIAFDLEYVPEGSIEGPIAPPRRDLRDVYCEIIQIGAVKFNNTGEEIDSLKLLIRPSFISHIPEWHVNLVGITEQGRQHGISFSEGARLFRDFIGADPDVWVFYGDAWVWPNSLKKHGLDLEFPPLRQFRPQLEHFGIAKQDFDARNLEFCSGNLHKVLNITIPHDNSGVHDALYDARSLGYSIVKLMN